MDPEPATRDRILDAAERLLAERGSAAVSLRDVLREADVANVGAVGYYFGVKDVLVAEVERRAVAAIDTARLAGLDELGDAPSAYDLVLAFTGPVARLRSHPRGRLTAQVFSRIFDEPRSEWERNGAQEVFAVTGRYLETTRGLLPDADGVELLWRWQSVTAMGYWYVAGYLDVFSVPAPQDVEGDVMALAAQGAAVLTAELPSRPGRRSRSR